MNLKGWKLVPLEQTDEMRTGGGQILDYEYDVLLSAVPTAPTEAMERVVELAELLVDAIIKSHRPVEIDNRTVGLHRALAALEKAMEKDDDG